MDNPHTILFVDDESNILSALRRLFRKENYRCIFASSGAEGLSILKNEKVSLVVSDHRMPEMTGTEFLQKVKRQFPVPLRVILSGYADANVIIDSINKGEIYRFFSKPWDDNDLRIRIRQCIEHFEFIQNINQLITETNLQNLELKRINENLKSVISRKEEFLKFYQSVYYHLPVPLVGISQEGLLVLTNEAFEKRHFFNASGIGNPIECFFPEKYVSHIRNCLKGLQPLSFFYDPEHKTKTTIQSMNLNEVPLGCLILMEEYDQCPPSK